MEIERLLSSGLENFGIRKLLGMTLSAVEELERSLVERDRAVVLIVVHDDSSGLLELTSGMFPQSEIQLCTVHLLRNANTRLGKADASEFTKRFRYTRNAWSNDVAAQQFEELCMRFEKSFASFVKKLRKDQKNYLAFLNDPDSVRLTHSTTNAVEAVNNQLELLRRNGGDTSSPRRPPSSSKASWSPLSRPEDGDAWPPM